MFILNKEVPWNEAEASIPSSADIEGCIGMCVTIVLLRTTSHIYFTLTLILVKPGTEITWELVDFSRYFTTANKNHLFYQVVEM